MLLPPSARNFHISHLLALDSHEFIVKFFPFLLLRFSVAFFFYSHSCFSSLVASFYSRFLSSGYSVILFYPLWFGVRNPEDLNANSYGCENRIIYEWWKRLHLIFLNWTERNGTSQRTDGRTNEIHGKKRSLFLTTIHFSSL